MNPLEERRLATFLADWPLLATLGVPEARPSHCQVVEDELFLVGEGYSVRLSLEAVARALLLPSRALIRACKVGGKDGGNWLEVMVVCADFPPLGLDDAVPRLHPCHSRCVEGKDRFYGWKLWREQDVRNHFQKGDLVRLVSGGPIMVVEDVGPPHEVHCAWFAGGDFKRDVFPAAHLCFVPSAGEYRTK